MANFLRPVERAAAAGVVNGELIVVGTDGGDLLHVVRAGTDAGGLGQRRSNSDSSPCPSPASSWTPAAATT